MKNVNYFPFERNKYFYGKLLSVDDFNLEQRYVNDKRRMANNFLFGSGIVAGMQVVYVDEQTVSVESGYALDMLGREVVIDTPVTKKLSLLDNFEQSMEENSSGYVYLCVEYDEKAAGIVHNIAGGVNIQEDNNSVAYNKVLETYRLFLTDKEPENENLSQAALYEESKTLYSEQGISIRQVLPKYVKVGQSAEMRIEIENYKKQYLAFSYVLDLHGFLYNSESQLKVDFNEMLYEKEGNYTLHYNLKAVDSANVDATIRILAKSSKMYLDKETNDTRFEGECMVKIIDSSIKEAVINSHYKTAMELITKNNIRNKLYLAKIYVVKAGEFYIIDRIRNVPFGQYVRSHMLETAIQQMDSLEYEKNFGERDSYGNSKADDAKDGIHRGIEMSQGIYEQILNKGGQKGEVFETSEIVHGLGLGNVVIFIGIENEESVVTYGNGSMLSGQSSAIEIGTKVYMEKGTFVVGGKFSEAQIRSSLRLHWTAVKSQASETSDKVVRRIFIKPSVLELSIRESYNFEVIYEHMGDKTIEWSISEHGGSIDHNGFYTAPNTPGVYEVTAVSTTYSEVKASVFVVVRDTSVGREKEG